MEGSSKFLNLVSLYGTRVLGVIVLLVAAWIVAGWVKDTLAKTLAKSKFDETLTKFISGMARYAILAFAGVAALGLFGVQTASFAAILAAAGFAIGMAFQGTLSNFSSGVMLLVFRPFKIGQVVNAAGVTGKINEISLFTTTMDTPDNRRIIVPNSSIFGSTIENISHHPTRRVDVNVGADYQADIAKTRQILETLSASVPGVQTEPKPQAVLTELGASSVDWQVRVWCATDDYWGVKEALTEKVKAGLDEAGIGIPFPQMDIHVQPTNSSPTAILEKTGHESATALT